MIILILQDPGISSEQSPGSYPPYDDGLKRNVFIKKTDGSGPIIGKVNTVDSHYVVSWGLDVLLTYKKVQVQKA